jgi:putative ABC transport system permease protein
MFKNYLKIAFRNLVKNKSYFLINTFGLATGMACCLLIILFIFDEISFDKFHKNAENIYRVVAEFNRDGKVDHFAHTPAPMAQALCDEYAEVKSAVRFAYRRQQLVSYQDKHFWIDRFCRADPGIFNVFTFPFVKGDSSLVLRDLYSIVITEDMAIKVFGEANPIGKILTIGYESTKDYKVTGVLKNIPSNSQLQFDCLVSFDHQKANTSWGAWNYDTYILLQNGVSPDELEQKLPGFLGKYVNEGRKSSTKLHLQSLTRIHLFSQLRSDNPTNRDVKHLYFFSVIGIIILLIACINYVNLATARSVTREREVGVRKVVGANRTQLIKQFLGESLLFSVISLIAALLAVEIFLPSFNRLTDKTLTFDFFNHFTLMIGAIGIALISGVLAGMYPAFFLSGASPKDVLTGGRSNLKTSTLRKSLVISQFVLSIIFIACTIVIHNQLSFMRNTNLGYNKDHLVVIPIFKQEVRDNYPIYKNEILENINILAASATSFIPDNPNYHQNTWWEGMSEKEWEYLDWISVDYDFVKTFEIEMSQGRDFSVEFSNDMKRGYILNESAVKLTGWENPLGKRFEIVDRGTVVGVVKDFNFQSLHKKITPVALNIYPGIYRYLYVRISPENISQSIPYLNQKWKQVYPELPFQYSFYDEDYDRIYKSEFLIGETFNYLAGLTILIASLGLFDLASFMAEKRTKEIGVRKVLGASVTNIVYLLSKEVIVLINVSIVIASPIAFYFMSKWLQNFAYRINIEWWVFLLAGMMGLAVALLTVSYQSIKAAIANPLKSIKYE